MHDQQPTHEELVFNATLMEFMQESHRRRTAEVQVQLLRAERDELRAQLEAHADTSGGSDVDPA